jgi:transcription elongation factor Elf1
MKCPVCNLEGAVECADEVDIGVGVMRHVWGFECPHCGEVPVCSECGGVGTEPGDHFSWCDRRGDIPRIQ